MIDRELFIKNFTINWFNAVNDDRIIKEVFYEDNKADYIKKRDYIISNLRLCKKFEKFSNIITAEGIYKIDKIGKGSWEHIKYVKDGVAHMLSFHAQYKNDATENEVENNIKGNECYEYINDAISYKLGRETTIATEIKSYKKKEIYNDVKKCVVSAFDYANGLFTNKEIKVYKADVSSAYPTQLKKALPTFEGCIKVEGRVEPNEEYPFAFYPDTHHIKIYNELDSREFKNCAQYPYYHGAGLGRKWQPNDFVTDSYTILCKKLNDKSHDAIFEAYNELYNSRKDLAHAKTIMNASIGYLQINKNPFASCIPAVVIARCVNDMIKRVKQLEKEGNEVVLVNTDSISWIGGKSKTYVLPDKKELGAFVLEEVNTRMIIRSVKAYQYYKGGTELKTICSGLNKEEAKLKQFGELKESDQKIVSVVINEEGLVI